MGSNPFQNQGGFDLATVLGKTITPGDKLLPQGTDLALDALRTQASDSLTGGSFSAKHPYGSAILSALAGAALGGIGGGMDSSVGAGKGALLGALMGGVQAPLLERQRKQGVAKNYMELAPKVLEWQKGLEDMRGKRAGGFYAKTLGENAGFDMSHMPDGPMSDALVQDAIGGVRGSAVAPEVTGLLARALGQGTEMGAGLYGSAANPQGMPQGGPQGLPPQPVAKNMGGGVMLEQDPSLVPQAMQAGPLQGGVMQQALPPAGSRGLPLVSEDVLKAMVAQIGPSQREGLQRGLEAPKTVAETNKYNADAKSTIEKLAAEIAKLQADATESKSRANLYNRTNPNIRGGGSDGSNAQMANTIRALQTVVQFGDDEQSSMALRQLQALQMGGAPVANPMQMLPSAQTGMDMGAMLQQPRPRLLDSIRGFMPEPKYGVR
jgi:hypothetical protein